MNKNDIQQGLAEVYMYNCHKCGQGNLSRDEVLARDSRPRYPKARYICLKCLYKDCLTETLGSVSNEIDKGG